MLLLARCEEGLGRPGDAERTLYRCLAATKCTAENKVSVYEGLSRLARAAGRHFSANRHLKKALEVGPHSRSQDSIRFLMIRASIDQGKLMDARSILKEVVHREDPEFALLSKQLGGSSASNRVIRPAPLAPKEPRIMSRKQWRARPVNFRGNPTRLGRPYRITIHHGAEKVAAPTSLSGAASRVRSYQSSHQVGNGWADIGYHFVIDAAGRIWEGRELKWQGAHAGSPAANKGNIGVCLMGDFEKVAPNYAQKKGLERLLDHLTTRYGISWRSVEGHNSVLQRHHRGRGTQCPGRHLQGWLDRLKRQHAS
jgi:hypothetical protein